VKKIKAKTVITDFLISEVDLFLELFYVLGCPEPEVAVFKDGESLQLCDEITLNKEKTTWTLTIQDVIKEDAGLYEICAVNSIGNDILKTRVYVKTVNRAPVENDETDTLNRYT
jgi:TusA-related sulfurtransferase